MTTRENSQARRPPARWLIRAAGSALVLGVTLWLLPREAIWTALRSVSWEVWLLALFGFLAGHAIAAVKWRLLASQANDIPLALAFRAHAGGLAANLCLPGVAGGDVVRAAIALGTAKQRAHVAVGSLADRVIDTFALLFLAGLGAAFSAVLGESFSLLGKIAIILVAGSAATAALLFGLRFLPNLPLKGLREKLARVTAEFGRRPGRLALCFALSVAVQAAFIALAILFAEKVGAHAPIAAWYFAWPLAKLVAILPISLAGLGVREAALASLLVPFGAAPALVVAASLLWQSILFAGGALGGLALVLAPPHKAAARRAENEATKEPA